MLKYSIIIDESTKEVQIGVGTNTSFYESIGMTLQEVEQAYTGAWYLKGYAPLQSLDELKQLKLQELKTITNAFENNLNTDMYFTSSLGFKANGDRRSQTNIANLITFFDVKKDEEGKVKFRTYDNTEVKLIKDDLNILYTEQIFNGENLYQQKWDYETAIKNADSLETLKAINIHFTMSDFSNKPKSLSELMNGK